MIIRSLISRLFIFLLILAVFLAFTYQFFLTMWDINSLSNSFFTIDISKNFPVYTLTSKRPSGWATINEISPRLIEAIILSEDSSFYAHPGIDVEQIQDAMTDYLKNGRPLRGASTITQQLIKNLFLTREKSIDRKLQEIFLALYLEKNVKKRKILELYLNAIEFGEKIYGIQKASWYYFQKPPSSLTAKEGAFLAMLLPNPKKYSISFRKKNLTVYAARTINHILEKMYQTKKISLDEFVAQVETPLVWEKSYKVLTEEE